MKLIIRADEMGFTETCNDGALTAADEGFVTAASVMLDTPGTEDALLRLKRRPYLSLDWAVKVWGSPAADVSLVPHLTGDDGHFCPDLLSRTFLPGEELALELDAEVVRCILLSGQAPFSALPTGNESVDAVLSGICEKYGIHYGYCGADGPVRSYGDEVRAGLCFENYDAYDPLSLLKDAVRLSGARPVMVTLQPGFLDEIVMAATLEGPKSSISIHRMKDVQVLCSPELDRLLKEEDVELVNLRDVLYGTKSYENYRRTLRS